MYPVVRMAKEIVKFRNAPALPITGTHVSHHICWPWDIDLWM
ncbi:MAG: thioeseterase, partial [Rhodobacteraceae bacterium]